MQMGVYIMELTEKKEFDLLSLGEIMLRLSPPDNERITRGDSFSKQAGGAELNAITGAAMLGLRCGIISKLPANDLGVYIKNRVRLCGVSDDYLVYDDDKDARLGVYYYENGAYPRKPRIVYDRKNTSINKLTVDDYDDKIYSDTRCFHTSGITLALSPELRATAVEMIKRFKAQGAIISFDVNFRGNLWIHSALCGHLLLLRGHGAFDLPEGRRCQEHYEELHGGVSNLHRGIHTAYCT